MIGHLEGRLRYKTPDYVIIDVNGVGYMVQVPLSTFYDLPETGETASLNIYTYVREDTLQLYGFRTLQEKEMFLLLITVNGIGPRLAANILSGITPDELRQVVMQQNRRRLQSLPGVGKKIADRIILELQDKLKMKRDPDAPPIVLPVETNAYSDALSALLNLGYKVPEAEKALKIAQDRLGPDSPIEDLLREALRQLARP